MKIAISVPDPLFRQAERTARRLRISRSDLYQRAIRAWLEAERGEDITEAYNRVCGETDTSLPPAIARLQANAIGPSKW
jgi:metal-responsive CopG/Arc/MetJ family transcriptional regulator